MAVGGAGRTTGLAALLVALGVVLAAGALPALAGQTPLDRVSDSASDGVDEAVASAAGEAGQPAPGELNDDVAAAAENAEVRGAARAAAGLLAKFLGEDAVGGALGGAADSVGEVDPSDAEISPESMDGMNPDGAPTAGDATDGTATGGTTADGTTTDGTTGGVTGDGTATDGTTGDTTTDGTTTDGTTAGDIADGTASDGATDGSTTTGEATDGTTDGASGGDGDAEVAGGDTTTRDGATTTGENGGDRGATGGDGDTQTGELTQDGDGTTTEQASETDGTAADEEGPPEPEGIADRGRLETAAIAIGVLLVVFLAVLAYRSDKPAIEFLRSVPTMLANGVTRFVFGIANGVERAVAALRSVASVDELRALLLAAVADTKRSVGRSLRSLLGREPEEADTAASPSLASDRQRIRDAWRTVVDLASVSRYPNRTPGEIKQRAVDAGLPEPPVATLLGAFRDVEYGDRDPGDRADAAVDAANQVETAAAEIAADEDDTAQTEDREP